MFFTSDYSKIALLAFSLSFANVPLLHAQSNDAEKPQNAEQTANTEERTKVSNRIFEVPKEWSLDSDKDGIEIYTQYREDLGLRSSRAVTEVKSALPQALMFLTNMPESKRWMDMLDSAVTLQMPNKEGVSYHHVVTKLPWPIKDRDLVMKTKIEYNSDLDEVIIESIAAPDYIPEEKGSLRVETSSSIWRLSRLDKETIRLELTSYASSGGKIPKWLANRSVTKLPRSIFSRLPPILESDEVQSLGYDPIFVFGKELELN